MYNFKEKNLSQDFCLEQVGQIKELIRKSTTFTVVGMPGIGISIFLRFLATEGWAYFIHVDIHELQALTKENLYQLLLKELGGKENGSKSDLIKLCSLQLAKLTKTHQRVVIIFNRFDQLNKEFNESFFGNLRSLRDVDKEKIVMLFAANKPLVLQSPNSFLGGNLNMYSTSFYLKPFSENDLKQLVKLNSPHLLQNPNFSKVINFSGGHYQLLQLILKSDYQSNLAEDPMIKIQLKALYDNLNIKLKKQLQDVALGKVHKDLDPTLIKLGYLNKNLKIFTPLFAKYILENTALKLSLKEASLYKLLKSRLGKVVAKDDIFAKVWNENEESTDWALDSLIYRLRKNPLFSSRYILESHKKQGYSLIKI